MWDKESIVSLLEKNDKAVIRAIVVVNQNQTADEQQIEGTKYQNGEGFRPCHARMGTSCANFYAKRGYMSPKQIAYWRVRDRKGNMRIGIYWKQLKAEIERKNANG